MKPIARRQLARKLAWGVLACQIATVAMFLLDPSDPPRPAIGLPGATLAQGLWALSHKPAFYPLAAVLIGGPPATWFALSQKGRHVRWLVAAWVVFIGVIAVFFAHRVGVMIDVLIRHGAG